MSNWKNINRDSLSPKDALEILIEGNKRFIDGVKQDQNLSLIRETLKEKQQTFCCYFRL